MLVGPRASGKTTTARRHVASVVCLDRAAEAGAFEADPDAALRRLPEPILLDEWQEVPGVLGAVKRAVDADARPGRFILTGSVRAEVEGATWPATGRVVRWPVFPLTRREIEGRVGRPTLIERLYQGDLEAFRPAEGQFDLGDYIDLALVGGFPGAALRLAGEARRLWLAGYLDEVVHRDTQLVMKGIDTKRFATFLEVEAWGSAAVTDAKKLIDAAHLDRRTFDAYEELLKRLHLGESVPGWWSSRLTRLVGAEKRYLVDTSLVATLLNVEVAGVMKDAAILGRILDSFVAMQLRPEVALSGHRPKLYHLRQQEGRHEVDLVIEFGGGKVAAIEVKATAAPAADDARHLAWLRDRLGDQFVLGLVLHTGPQDFVLGDRLVAAPISTLWN
ncbi:MAG: DUF4143 domain-containing protein [Bifidobacteriaceae bacterium]|nr:DUF4143 domain-containing protein [Bifidobacteriaceae bacterium]